jgi:hypothetical protein
MSTLKANELNHLMGEFMTLYELWKDSPDTFPWERQRALAVQGALAYNEGYGPSFQILAFDGYAHAQFHERFLGELLDAGFDPFKTVPAPSGISYIPVFGHDGLASAAKDNVFSARMLAALHAAARRQFSTAALATIDADELARVVLLCHETIPEDVLVAMMGICQAA